MSRPVQTLRRRAAVAVLAAFLMVGLLGMVAFGIDTGYIMLVRTQLQTAADSAAMAAAGAMGGTSSEVIAAAQQFSAYHLAGGKSVTLASSDVEFGNWDKDTRVFTPSGQIGNAVRVTARRNNTTNGEANLFFARIFGRNSIGLEAQAIAMANPREIAFVVDLSGSMNDDTEPAWVTGLIDAEYASESANAGTNLMTQVYSDFGYGSYPGTLQYVGAPLGVAADQYAYAEMTKDNGPLAALSDTNYKILSTDSESTRKTKAYRWIIMNQIATVMPGVKPTPNITTNFNYWSRYLDFIMRSQTISSSSPKGKPPNSRGALPPSQNSYRLNSGANNPNGTSWPSASSSITQTYQNRIGYLTYVQFMMDHGRDSKPDGNIFVPLSRSSPDCPMHNETVSGRSYSFPPSAQPTHAARRAIIAAIELIAERNAGVANNNKDWVSLITFDKGSNTNLRCPLTGDYASVQQSCTTMQEVADNASSTATEYGLNLANTHLKPTTSGGAGRSGPNRVVVLLTDGMPNLYQSSNSTINNYISNNPSSDFYGSSNYAHNAALMSADIMEGQNWAVYPVGLGLGTDYTFMDRMSRLGGTADENGQSLRGSGNPTEYEQRLVDMFREIITSPQVRLVY
ncbi:MAG: VWA domain-containing protein [Pirellulales bacterium]|nr:VWA domain-containing protein [Pirellulales bacterium]